MIIYISDWRLRQSNFHDLLLRGQIFDTSTQYEISKTDDILWDGILN